LFSNILKNFIKNNFYFSIKKKDLATPTAFSRSPSLVWEFYHYRREVVRTKEPNKV
jgi:NAD-dependent deacetylase sirtuin 5